MSREQLENAIARRKLLAGIGAAGAVGLAGCAGNGDENGAENGDDDDETDVIRWHAGGTGGTYFPLSGEIEGIIESNTDFDVEVSATGASVENVGSLGSGEPTSR